VPKTSGANIVIDVEENTRIVPILSVIMRYRLMNENIAGKTEENPKLKVKLPIHIRVIEF
jgi:hypothetical protein